MHYAGNVKTMIPSFQQSQFKSWHVVSELVAVDVSLGFLEPRFLYMEDWGSCSGRATGLMLPLSWAARVEIPSHCVTSLFLFIFSTAVTDHLCTVAIGAGGVHIEQAHALHTRCVPIRPGRCG